MDLSYNPVVAGNMHQDIEIVKFIVRASVYVYEESDFGRWGMHPL